MKQGLLGELKAQLILTWLGYECSKPLDVHVSYDLLAIKDGKVYKVQVKTTSTRPNKQKPDRYEVSMATSGGNRKVNTRKVPEDGDFDLLFAMVDDGRCWLIPQQDLTSKHSAMLGTEHYARFQITEPLRIS